MIQIKRKSKAIDSMKRDTSVKMEKEIAHDYFHHHMSIAYLSRKYNRTKTQINELMSNWDIVREDPPEEFPEIHTERLVLIDSRDWEFAQFLLAEYGTRYREPGEYTFSEEFVGKI